MSQWTRICAHSELLPGEHRVVEVDGAMVAVFNVDGEIYAIEDVCTHDGAELTGGPFVGHTIECPRHGARFDVRTGEVLRGPAWSPISRFPIRIENDAIWSRDDRWD
ncbi:MAG: non-heme iron oxygenase ferredoxin subunit [Porticoccaceae bacterium]